MSAPKEEFQSSGVAGRTSITRRSLLIRLGCSSADVGAQLLLPRTLRAELQPELTSKRPPPQERRFRSDAVEAFIASTSGKIGDKEVAAIFRNCFPNTLDTTIEADVFEGKPDTVVVTGDIPAMWLRDSSAQVWPYLALANQDPRLRKLLEGVIRRQTRCLLIDVYANSFMADLSAPPLEWSRKDLTEMKQGVGERKYELDSLCFPIRLSHRYWKNTGDTSPFDSAWKQAMTIVLETMRIEQQKSGPGPYRFQRQAFDPTDSLVNGLGNPLNPVGLIASAFRPSDDACILPFLVPSNLFAVTSLRQLAAMSSAILQDPVMACKATDLANEVEVALRRYATTPTNSGSIWAYEVDGFGNQIQMDDANVPSLLSLPYLESSSDAALYARTRKFVWSRNNPWFFKGKAGEGIGGPHIGRDSVWPMSQILYALTSTSPVEISHSIRLLRESSAGTGFIHESYNMNDPSKFTRKWFGWANSLFGELIAKIAHSSPELLR